MKLSLYTECCWRASCADSSRAVIPTSVLYDCSSHHLYVGIPPPPFTVEVKAAKDKMYAGQAVSWSGCYTPRCIHSAVPYFQAKKDVFLPVCLFKWLLRYMTAWVHPAGLAAEWSTTGSQAACGRCWPSKRAEQRGHRSLLLQRKHPCADCNSALKLTWIGLGVLDVNVKHSQLHL